MAVASLEFNVKKFRQQVDAREAPAYSIPEAAHYLQLPAATLRSWVLGRDYPVAGGGQLRRFQPIIELPDKNLNILSFCSLVEAHVLSAFRREYKVPLPHIRRALKFVVAKSPSKHPLIDQRFETDGKVLFIRRLGQLIDATSQGQMAMGQVLDAYLQRIERDAVGFALRLYPFTTPNLADARRWVVIDPRIAFGRPVLRGTRIPTSVIAERYKAGESIDELASDYGRQRAEIEEALRCELHVAA